MVADMAKYDPLFHPNISQPGRHRRLATGPAAIVAALICASPAPAQDPPPAYELGPYWNVSAIDVEAGHFEEYMAYLAGRWREIQEFSRRQGWILDYHILSNVFPREGEPDLYLMIRYADFPSTDEFRRRERIILEHLRSDRQAISGEMRDRARIVRQGDQMLLRELTLGR